jgi:hypothetical protein
MKQKEEPITDEYFEYRLNHTMKVGESCGLKEAAGIVMAMAVDAFKRKGDDAEMLRELAEKIEEAGKKRHPGPPK